MLFLLDNGHGGVINNVYQTPGKRSPIWDDGSQLFEGEFNRAIVNGLAELLHRHGIPYVKIAPEDRDVSLAERVRRANVYSSIPSLFVSIHANAGGGSGCEFFTSPGQTKADEFADLFAESFKWEFPYDTLRADYSDGDADKEEHFYVLTKTSMPAILTENFFMDNEGECKNHLMSFTGRHRIISYHFRALLQIHENFKAI